MPDVYEIVNATQLDSDLEDIADAIRAKTGGQSALDFPNEFISEIGNISGGTSITGATDLSSKAIETMAAGDTTKSFTSTKLSSLKAINTAIGRESTCCKFSPDGKLICVTGMYASDGAKLFDSSTINYTRITNKLPKIAKQCSACGWSPDGTRLVLGISGSPYIYIYDTTTTPYTQLTAPATLPTGKPNACVWSPDGTRLAIAHQTSPFITIYDTTTTPYTKIADPGTLPTSIGKGCSWSPNGSTLAVSLHQSPYVMFYDTTTTPYTQLTNPATLPPSFGGKCAYSPDGAYFAIAHYSSPYITIYDTSTTPYTKISNPGTLPAGNGNSCCWSADGKVLIVGHEKSAYITAYKTTSVPFTKITASAYTPTGCTSSYGIADVDMYDVFIVMCNLNTSSSSTKPSMFVLGDVTAKASNTNNRDCKMGYTPNNVAQNATSTFKIVFNN